MARGRRWVSAGVFETIRVRAGRVPFLERHAARLAAACHALRLPQPSAPLEHLVRPLLTAGEMVVRVEVGPGGTSVTTRPVPPHAPLTMVIAATRHRPYPFKLTERAVFAAAQAEAQAAGTDEAVLITPHGLVAEGTVWSIFWWEDDRLVTPPLTLGVLPGVARARVLELLPVVERERTPAELVRRSLFATNAVRGVVTVARLDGASVPSDHRTPRLAERFWPD